MTFTDLLSHDRIFMLGPPEVWKTTLAKSCRDRWVIHLDDIMELHGFEDTPRFALLSLAGKDRYLVEGTQAYRVLRYAFRNELFGPPRFPPEVVAFVHSPRGVEKRHRPFVKGQNRMLREVGEYLKINKIPLVGVKGRPV